MYKALLIYQQQITHLNEGIEKILNRLENEFPGSIFALFNDEEAA